MIRLEHVTLSFGGLKAVDDVSVDIPAGQITGLIGPNGAGKTTLFNAIAGRVIPSSGHVYLEGEDITSLKPHQRAKRGLARTFQIPHEFARLTVLENLMVAGASPLGESVLNVIFRRSAFKDEDRDAFHRASETLEFLELDRLKFEKAGNLSGGQKKLLELGRALMGTPKIVLLDEIGAGINRTLLGKIAEKIKRLNADRQLTFCLIEHDLDFVSTVCDSVIVMAQGSVLTKGDIASVRNDERVIEVYFGGGRYEEQA